MKEESAAARHNADLGRLNVEFKINIYNHELLPHIRAFKNLENINMLKGDIMVLNYTFKVPVVEPDLLENLSSVSSILEDNTSSLEFNEEEYNNYTCLRNLIDELTQKFQKLDTLVVKKWGDNAAFHNDMVNNLATPGYEPNSIEKAFVGCELEKR